ncbi:hypothetical protein [Aureimonas glaciei]|uniref:Uncharacterized protein n=1 Tax=Aureimonas glaciei TaxID=1776957 RepID=A0A917DKB2_9HYPH|nr:hypothetical protein [Aureimonas glaciei]GGD43042.1 hypothetical protein GCM10011335_52120 [Aureimonas glaciei]
MKIIIQNISEFDGAGSLSNYVLRIDDMTISYFQHDRTAGLGQCLRSAADAADAADEHHAWTLKKMLEKDG